MELSSYFLVIPPGFEKVALSELSFYLKKAKVEAVNLLSEKGGISLLCTAKEMATLSHHLKIPTRILLRIGQFKAKDFAKLYKELLKVRWHDYLFGEEYSFHVSCKMSRLMQTKRIENCCRDALSASLKDSPLSKKQKEKIDQHPLSFFIRVVDDIVNLSIDFCGPNLRERKGKFSSVAPIRENLAAATIWKLLDYSNNQEMSTFLDPCCGSGTLLKEALTLFEPNQASFHYQKMKIFCSLTPKMMTTDSPFEKIIGKDIDPQAISTSKKNIKDKRVSFKQEDLFSKEESKQSMDFILSNLPYGERIKIPKNFFQNLLPALESKYQPSLIGLIAPEGARFSRRANEVLAFSNGGIKVKLYLFKKEKDKT